MSGVESDSDRLDRIRSGDYSSDDVTWLCASVIRLRDPIEVKALLLAKLSPLAADLARTSMYQYDTALSALMNLAGWVRVDRGKPDGVREQT